MPKGVVWRQEDVLCVLGGLVNFDTGIRVEDEWQFANAAAEAPDDAGLGIVIAPLMHGAAQWGTLNGLLNGRTTVLMPKFDADDVWHGGRQAQDPDARRSPATRWAAR